MLDSQISRAKQTAATKAQLQASMSCIVSCMPRPCPDMQ